jgi:hypothetical protein
VLGKDLGEAERRERRPDRGLQHDGIAGGERRPELPAGHVEGVVPGRDRGHDADRVAADDRGVTGDELVRGEAVHDPAGAREEPEEVGADGHLVDRRGYRLAGIGRLDPADLVAGGLEGVGDLEQDQAAVLGRRLAPRLERGRGRVDGPVDVLLVGRRHLRDDLAVRRVLDVQRLARRRVDELAADELLIGLHPVDDVGHFGVSCR